MIIRVLWGLSWSDLCKFWGWHINWDYAHISRQCANIDVVDKFEKVSGTTPTGFNFMLDCVVRPKTRYCKNGFIMSSCLDMNMWCRLHLYVLIMKYEYIHVDIIDHALHKDLGLWTDTTTLPRVHPYISAW